ncbi:MULTISPECIES: hypothetical protein [Nocardia]|uniref:Uncharacterized protein n=1 Tax=Nocardia asteroides NBRC 15531 TaxID=1110697 RepID=U5EL14_NOCAS|nr:MULTISPECIES: hypothetical protein [Nocardia]TLF63383.1 hypothetical protein FEK33_25445 [Nocardia asteroides NBRC 15531]UGT47188.1 hypothetical protein LT345_22070 [Nocardia asteroides]SFM76971.1 hypothetical protein SAMN05444423_104162 [Nocardia asteroides]VEG33930.1 Uncharacterised protein [Nocardia asteroides]GAD87086.1 hypothetical protein NCAST_34_02160 [Nocardia asteroides NBRC 15531]
MTDNTATDQTPTDTDTRGEVVCPIEVGDEVTGLNNRTWRGVVLQVFDHHVPECVIETDTGGRGFAAPWSLVPAHQDPSAQWLDRMRAYRDAKRDEALDRLRSDQEELAEAAETLAERLTEIAATLRTGRFRDPEDEDPIEHEGTSIDDGLGHLAETRQNLIDSGLLSPPEIRQYLDFD